MEEKCLLPKLISRPLRKESLIMSLLLLMKISPIISFLPRRERKPIDPLPACRGHAEEAFLFTRTHAQPMCAQPMCAHARLTVPFVAQTESIFARHREGEKQGEKKPYGRPAIPALSYHFRHQKSEGKRRDFPTFFSPCKIALFLPHREKNALRNRRTLDFSKCVLFFYGIFFFSIVLLIPLWAARAQLRAARVVVRLPYRVA